MWQTDYCGKAHIILQLSYETLKKKGYYLEMLGGWEGRELYNEYADENKPLILMKCDWDCLLLNKEWEELQLEKNVIKLFIFGIYIII